jgi:hypothetical protein
VRANKRRDEGTKRVAGAGGWEVSACLLCLQPSYPLLAVSPTISCDHTTAKKKKTKENTSGSFQPKHGKAAAGGKEDKGEAAGGRRGKKGKKGRR